MFVVVSSAAEYSCVFASFPITTNLDVATLHYNWMTEISVEPYVGRMRSLGFVCHAEFR